MKCLNNLCKNILPEHRIKNQSYRVSKWNFCVKCLKFEKEPIRYKCKRKYCNEDIIFSQHVKTYCSGLCKGRNRSRTNEPVEKRCKYCDEIFFTRFINKQNYCTNSCWRKDHRKTVKRYKNCKYCEIMFMSRSSKYCSTDCKKSEYILLRNKERYDRAIKRRTLKRHKKEGMKK